ncbi:MAG: GTPase HflX [Dehalococcoidales bacterium]|nr:GTPase HflX [Dehalococcoidales bacterium]
MELKITKQPIIITKEGPERAFLVAVDTKDITTGWTTEASLEELALLAKSSGVVVVGKIIQKLPEPHKSYYLGKGKIEELLQFKGKTGYTVAVFDDELSPMQQNNLENALKVKIIDRTALILDIFARRARTHEGRLQVELAQHQYLLPRLAGQWSHLERLGGGIGTRGPGETQLETDRRLIRTRISRLKNQIEKIRRHRELYRQKRRKTGIPVVALVGYTNAGKSTLLNAASRAGVLAKDELFSTLDPTTRRIALPNGKIVLFSDTVGLIRKLPPTIVTAFRATLEELADADLLVQVVDLTSHNAAEQCQTVEYILSDLGLTDKPRITALNKIDMLLDKEKSWDEISAVNYLTGLNIEYLKVTENTVFISAAKKWGLTGLLRLIEQIIEQERLNTSPETGFY